LGLDHKEKKSGSVTMCNLFLFSECIMHVEAYQLYHFLPFSLAAPKKRLTKYMESL
jgi:hypothetical protein